MGWIASAVPCGRRHSRTTSSNDVLRLKAPTNATDSKHVLTNNTTRLEGIENMAVTTAIT